MTKKRPLADRNQAPLRWLAVLEYRLLEASLVVQNIKIMLIFSSANHLVKPNQREEVSLQFDVEILAERCPRLTTALLRDFPSFDAEASHVVKCVMRALDQSFHGPSVESCAVLDDLLDVRIRLVNLPKVPRWNCIVFSRLSHYFSLKCQYSSKSHKDRVLNCTIFFSVDKINKVCQYGIDSNNIKMMLINQARFFRVFKLRIIACTLVRIRLFFKLF